MKRLVMSLAWLGLLCGTVVMAQEPKPAAKAAEQEISDPTATQWTVEKLDQLPKREVKFEQSDQPLPRQHVPLNATLLAQRYIATLNFEQPQVEQNARPVQGRRYGLNDIGLSSLPALQGELSRLPYVGNVILVGNSMTRMGIDDRMSIGFERIIKQIPKDRLPADKETLAFFTSEDIDRGCLMIHANLWSGANLKRQTKISILAPTAELAEKRAAMLLELLDQGYFRAIQKVSLKHHTTAAEDWRKYRTTQQEEEAQSLELKQQLAEYADFPAELLADARALQLQADIALADAKARTTTCDALLTSNEPLSQALRDKVHVLKLEIKVELAGIEARQAKSAEYVNKVTTAIQLAKKSETLALKRRQTNGSLNSLAKMLHELDAAIQVYEPMPLVDVKVVVQPVEWVP